MPKGLYKTENLSDFKPARFTSEGTVTLCSGTIPYRTVCEDNVFYNKEGKAIASIFSYSYFRSDVKDPTDRPVLFGFNGGPGSSSMMVHVGFLGTKRMKYFADPDQPTTLPPYEAVDNIDCLLDVADIVVVDPVATGYGLLYLTDEMLRCNGKSLKGKTVAVSGAGNVATYAIEKAWQLGAKPVTCSDSTGWVYDPEGIDVAALKEIKEVKRARLTEYKTYRPHAEYHEGRGVWTIPCDVALPCATQNELLLEDAETLVKNGVKYVAEGANMPTTLEATQYLQSHGVAFAPGKAANAGGVATSALEMSQNSMRLSWTFEEVDAKLHDIMVGIHKNAYEAAKEYGHEGNYVMGANIAGFLKVADAMMAQGVV
mgnify:CR=1 FL=1